jgi:multiple antibiotic resistance protein
LDPLTLFLKAFMTFLVVMDPIGLAPVFLGLAAGRPPREQAEIARRAVLIAALLLVLFALFGEPLLRYLGIRLEAFRIAGGLLLLKIAVDMVFAHRERETPEEEAEARLRGDISVFPLAIPLLVGPGAMASVLVLTGEARTLPLGAWIVIGAGLFVLLLAYLALVLSRLIARVLGRTGVNVITRVLGILLAALAVEFMVDGLLGVFRA